MNTSHSSDSHVPPIMSFRKHQKSPHLWEWDTIAPNTSYFPTPAASLLDCPPPLLPMNSTLPFYSTVRPEESGVGGSQMIGLNLGHRTYFSSGEPLEFASRRCVYSLGHHHQPPRCQAEGCKTDLSGAKHYHRRHKVCELHSKAAVVVAGGMQQRFCQQCSRFHVLAEFDEAKRSCRKRLADHNRRRRKPHGPHLSASTPQISAPKTSNTTPNGNNHHTPTTITSLERERSYQPKAAHSTDTTYLSLGGVVEGVEEEGMRWSQSNSSYQHHQELFLVMSDDHKSSHQHQLGIPASSTSDTLFHVHGQNLLCNSQEVSQTTGGESDQHQSSLLHLGQAMFETDFM